MLRPRALPGRASSPEALFEPAYLKGKLIGVFVAGHAHGKEYETLYVHPGLTYGELVSNIILKYS
jgi:hypothetical protein